MAVFYAGGYLAQFIGNYALWQEGGGYPGDGTSPVMPSPAFWDCVRAVFGPPYGVYGVFTCIGLLAILVLMVMKMGYGDTGEYDRERNFIYSNKGTYGTSGWMARKEMAGVLELVPDLRGYRGMVFGLLGGRAVCVPEKTALNANVAVYGASGSMKTRSFCMNRILQGAARGESLVICDPKSELYEKASGYLRDRGYVVKVFNLVSPGSSDSWNCLAEIGGEELMAQLFVEVVIKNTAGGGKGDHFWDANEGNLLKALVLFVGQGYAPEHRNIGEVYRLLALNTESELARLFDSLPPGHPARVPYSFFKQASENVRGNVVTGLGSRLQVFQSEMVRKITARNEIDLELPGRERCAYFVVTSDQDSTFDFLSSLFLSFLFIRLVRYADLQCEGGKLPVPVHVLGEEICACGVIPDLGRKISVIRSRNLSISLVFQNLAGLQNRYPYQQWQELLGNCDVQYFLGCTDELTAEFISNRTGVASVAVTSKAKQLGTWRVSDYTPEYRETSGVGRRAVLTPDEVLRLPVGQALVIIRGKKVLKVDKMDYSMHPEYPKLYPSRAAEHEPEWRKMEREREEKPKRPPLKPEGGRAQGTAGETAAPKTAASGKKPGKRNAGETETVPQEREPRETVPQETTSQGTALRKAAAQGKALQKNPLREKAPQKAVPQETALQETVPQETALQDTAPQSMLDGVVAADKDSIMS